MRKKGFLLRYLRYQCQLHRQWLILYALFLSGALFGSLLGSQEPTILSELSQRLAAAPAPDLLLSLTEAFAADALLLGIFFLCGLGAVFQPVVLILLFLKGFGFGVLGVYFYSQGDSPHALYYLCGLLPQAIAEALLLTCAAGDSLKFSTRFFFCLAGKSALPEEAPMRFSFYLARFILFYLLFGTVCLGAAILKHIFFA